MKMIRSEDQLFDKKQGCEGKLLNNIFYTFYAPELVSRNSDLNHLRRFESEIKFRIWILKKYLCEYWKKDFWKKKSKFFHIFEGEVLP